MQKAIFLDTPAGYVPERYKGWREWWLTARFRERHPMDIPTPGHIRVFAAIVDGLGSPWNISTKWERCQWYHSAKGAVSIAIRSRLASFDFDRLTQLVLAAHRHQVRVEVKPCNMQYLRVTFWPRDLDGDCIGTRHPTLSDLAAAIEEHG